MNYVQDLMEHYPRLEGCRPSLEAAIAAIVTMHRNGGKLLLCGNGGSAADSSHISGELLKGFLLKRNPTGRELEALTQIEELAPYAPALQKGVCAVALPDQSAVLSAFANDVCPDSVYAQLVYAMGRKGDMAMGLSTSGNSKNVVLAMACAKAMGLCTIGLTGEKGGKLAEICDVVIRVPETETFRVQELHLPVYHVLCAQVEEILFGET